MIQVKNLNKIFGELHVLRDINFNLGAQQILNISGASGCGKSTLLRCIAGLVKLDSGTIELNNAPVQSDNIFVPPHKRNIGMVFQNLSLWPHMNVFMNIDFVSQGIFKSKKERHDWNNELLHRFKIHQKRLSYPAELSGGEQQRVAIARALANRPRFLLLDEAFSHLDIALTSEIQKELQHIITADGLIVLYVSHKNEEICPANHKLEHLNLGK